jgi:hypothetical protein
MKIVLELRRVIELAKLYNSQAWLYQRYVVEKKNIVEIAKEAGCSHMTIQRSLEKMNLIGKKRI